MNKNIIILVIALTLVVAPVSVWAQSNGNRGTESVQNQNQSGNDDSAGSQDVQEEVQNRLEQQRAEPANALSEARRNRLVNVCSSSQTKLAGVLSGTRTTYQNRSDTYNQLVEKLLALQSRLRLNHPDVETADLTTAISQLQSRIDSFFENYDLYVAALEDISTIVNCENDPTQFHELLQLARQLRLELKNGAGSIKTSLEDDITPVLNTIKQNLMIRTMQAEDETGA